MELNFLHISDPHFLRSYYGKGGVLAPVFANMTPPLKQLSCLMDECIKRPDFVLLTGDLCEHGEAADYAALKTALDRIFPGIPVVVTPGNHDNRECFYDGYLGLKPRETPYFDDIMCGGVRVISIDSSSAQHPNGIITSESCMLLEKALQKNKDIPTLLITHHHLIEEQFTMPPAQFPDNFVQLISDSQISAVFNGHTHHFYTGVFAGKPCYTADSISFYGETDGGGLDFFELPGFTQFVLEDTQLKLRRIRLEAQPRSLGKIVGI